MEKDEWVVKNNKYSQRPIHLIVEIVVEKESEDGSGEARERVINIAP